MEQEDEEKDGASDEMEVEEEAGGSEKGSVEEEQGGTPSGPTPDELRVKVCMIRCLNARTPIFYCFRIFSSLSSLFVFRCPLFALEATPFQLLQPHPRFL